MPKLQLTDTMEDIVIKMSEGNPGAINILMVLMGDHPAKIDPANIMGGIGTILFLDTLGIYGPNLYMLSNDCCGRNLPAFLTIIRATQLGLYPRQDLLSSIKGKYGRGFNLKDKVNELLKQVQEKIPEFNDGKPIQWED